MDISNFKIIDELFIVKPQDLVYTNIESDLKRHIKKISPLISDLRYYFLMYFSKYYLHENRVSETNYIKSIIIKTLHFFRHILKINKKEYNPDILFLSRDRLIYFFDKKKQLSKSDYLFWDLIEYLKEKYSKKELLLWNTSSVKYDDLNIEMIPEYYYLTISDIINAIINSLKINYCWKQYFRILNATGNQKKIINELNHFFSFRYLFSIFLNKYNFQTTLRILQSKKVICNDETLFLKPFNIQTEIDSIQSSIIWPDREIILDKLNNLINYSDLKVDKYITTSENFRKIKEISGSSKRIYSVGQIRYNNIINMDFDIIDFKLKHNISLKKKLISWPTETHGNSSSINIRLIQIIYRFMKFNLDWELNIKLHPDEDQEARLYNKYKPKNVKIFQNNCINIHQLISVSDVIITQNSTTGLESILMRKPIIVPDFLTNNICINYKKNNIGYYFKNYYEFAKILKEKIPTYNELSYKIFINKIFGKSDINNNKEIMDIVFDSKNKLRY